MAERLGSELLILHANDNVATTLRNMAAGEVVPFEDALGERRTLVLAEPIPFGHKVAVRDVASGDLLYKYGEVIGRAFAPIPLGTHVHVHNVESLRGRGDIGGRHTT